MMVKDVVGNLDSVRGYDPDEFSQYVIEDADTKQYIDISIDAVMDCECVDAFMMMGGFLHVVIRR